MIDSKHFNSANLLHWLASSVVTKISVATCLFILALASGYWCSVLGKQQELLRLISQEGLQKATLSLRARQVPKLRQIESETAQLRSLYLATYPLQASEQDMDQLLNDIHRVGQNAQVDITRLKWEKSSKLDLYDIYPLNLDIKGSWYNIGSFFSYLINLPFLIVSQRVEWLSLPTESQTIKLQIKANLLVMNV